MAGVCLSSVSGERLRVSGVKDTVSLYLLGGEQAQSHTAQERSCAFDWPGAKATVALKASLMPLFLPLPHSKCPCAKCSHLFQVDHDDKDTGIFSVAHLLGYFPSVVQKRQGMELSLSKSGIRGLWCCGLFSYLHKQFAVLYILQINLSFGSALTNSFPPVSLPSLHLS